MKKAKRMRTVLDYVAENWDKSFKKLPFNDVDNVILSELAYIPFEKVLGSNFKDGITFKELFIRYLAQLSRDDFEKESDWFKNHLFLSLAIFNSTRYSKLKILRFRNVFSEVREAQFNGALVELPDKTLCVVFRGTDSSILGWKEDFNMIYMDETTGMRLAKTFLKKCIKLYPDRKFRVMGHSKGGVFATYSCLGLSKGERDNLINVYSNDGPGLHSNVYNSKEYQEIKDKIIHIVPKDSVIGILLHHDEITLCCDYLDGTELFNAHDAYTWIVDGTSFLPADRTPLSYYLDAALLDLCESLPLDNREKFVEVFFDALSTIGYETADEIFADPDSVKKVLGALMKARKKDKVINAVIIQIISSFRKTYSVFSEKNKELKKKQADARKNAKLEAKRKKEMELHAKKADKIAKSAQNGVDKSEKGGGLFPLLRRKS